MKIDIERAECALFADPEADQWLAHVGALVMEFPDEDAPGTTAVVVNALERTGYSWTWDVAGECLIWRRTIWVSSREEPLWR